MEVVTEPHPTQSPPMFDYVIVGAGASAMGLLYGLLSPFSDISTPPPFTIAVLERGQGPPHHAATTSPSDWCKASQGSTGSASILESYMGSRVMGIPTGKGLGGTTNINACLCTPPARVDFETWPAPWRETMLRSVHAVQDAMCRNDAIYHVTDCDFQYGATVEIMNSIPIVKPTNANPWRESVFPSLVSGVPTSTGTDDKANPIRKNYHQALLEPLLATKPHIHDCITWFRGAEVQRLLLDENHVRGVEYASKSRLSLVCARRDVIVCAGAIETPALLLVSGIGHENDLEVEGIKPRIPCSRLGVGRQLYDHLILTKLFLTPWCSSPVKSRSGVSALAHIATKDNRFQIMVNDARMFSQAVPHHGASIFRRAIPNEAQCPAALASVINSLSYGVFRSLRSLLSFLLNYSPLYFVSRRFLVSANVVLLDPKSTGKVAIRRNNTESTAGPLRRRDVKVVVDLNYLDDTADIVSFWDGWQAANQVFQIVFPKRIELFPGNILRCLAWLQRKNPTDVFASYARQFVMPYFHWCGTCAMQCKGNEEWVVDSQLRVRGVTGIRICDASVFPTTVCGPTALTCAGLGHGLSVRLSELHEKKKM